VTDDDNEPVEIRCSNCFDRVRQTRLDAEDDDFCSDHCRDHWLSWWSAAKSVKT